DCEKNDSTCSQSHRLTCGPRCRSDRRRAQAANAALQERLPEDNRRIKSLQGTITDLTTTRNKQITEARKAINKNRGIWARETERQIAAANEFEETVVAPAGATAVDVVPTPEDGEVVAAAEARGRRQAEEAVEEYRERAKAAEAAAARDRQRAEAAEQMLQRN